MKFAVVSVLLMALIGVAVEGATDPCADAVKDQASGNYKNPLSGEGLFGAWHCMTYYECTYDATTKKAKSTEKECWFLLPLRQYDPVKRQCNWFWNVKDCKASNPSPTPAPIPTTTTTPKPTTPTTTSNPTPPTTTPKPAPNGITTSKPSQ